MGYWYRCEEMYVMAEMEWCRGKWRNVMYAAVVCNCGVGVPCCGSFLFGLERLDVFVD
jgi:hypothetical protein